MAPGSPETENSNNGEMAHDSEAFAKGSATEVEVVASPGLKTYISFRYQAALTGLAGLSAVSMLPLFLVSASLPYIVADLGGEDSYTWIVIVNTLSFASVAVFTGILSDKIGRRYFALVGPLFIIAGMAVLGTAQTMPVGIGGMALAGAGMGICQVIGISGVAEIVAVNHRGRILGTIYLLFSPMAPAPAYAQIYSFQSTWRWGAWISMGLALATLIVVLVGYHPQKKNTDNSSWSQGLSNVDYIGGLLSVAGTALFLLALQWGGYEYAWTSAHVLAPLIIGFILLVGFFLWQIFSSSPSIPKSLLSNARISIPLLSISALGGAAFSAIGAFWVLECQQIFGPDPHDVARILVAVGFAFLLGIFFAGWAIDLSRGRIREVFLIASSLAAAGLGAMNCITADTPGMGIGLSFLAGLGLGGMYVPTAIALAIASPDDVLGAITGLDLSMRWVGAAIGYAVYFNLFQSEAVVAAGLPLNKVPAFLGALLAKNTTALVAAGATPTIIGAAEEAVVESYTEGFQLVYLVTIAFTGAAIIVSLFLKDIRRYIDGRIAVQIK